MGIIKGDLKKMIGFKVITIDDGENQLNIDLSQTRFEDIENFISIPIKAMKGKKFNELTTEDMVMLNDLQMEWYINYFKDKCPEVPIEDLKLFIVKNKTQLHKEFTIAFNIKTKEQMDEDIKKAVLEVEKLEKN